ncbi:TIGR00282 family metallophosphoesterase [Mycoplasmopsis gallopavonis]|uniref:Metallophosphoesterase YmdB n=1 Tax=Mycoplasmopsis gallopavonis TaxID=76629 RepID=A0A449B0H8_9BACT|nr:TIGR00282 family metallophosphoesterase [Mycoplasmopsis gallopavonis]RIV17022.1 YmdB family metallophosphoesterase [Mycoplasmopsis gallopavonis]VEU73273.1 metallophosphoesterase YmdB [Mycoplasmopsis gallopavonis]
MKTLKLLFIGDIFGKPGIETVKNLLPKLIKEHNLDFVIAQGENATGRKGLSYQDYQELSQAGVNCFTMGNHVWANQEIFDFIDHENIVRPFNISETYRGLGTKVFKIESKNLTLRVTSIMGITFNPLLRPWEQEYADNFFDAADRLLETHPADFDFIDFHGETTSEKHVFALYLDGQVDAVCGTHTHVQTNDYKVLPNGTCYISDAGMTGPENSAIGANFQEVYEKMRFDSKKPFKVSPNLTQFNSVILELNQDRSLNKIYPLNYEHLNFSEIDSNS